MRGLPHCIAAPCQENKKAAEPHSINLRDRTLLHSIAHLHFGVEVGKAADNLRTIIPIPAPNLTESGHIFDRI